MHQSLVKNVSGIIAASFAGYPCYVYLDLLRARIAYDLPMSLGGAYVAMSKLRPLTLEIPWLVLQILLWCYALKLLIGKFSTEKFMHTFLALIPPLFFLVYSEELYWKFSLDTNYSNEYCHSYFGGCLAAFLIFYIFASVVLALVCAVSYRSVFWVAARRNQIPAR